MQNIKVSIIIPVYNVEKYLDACLGSVLAQSFAEIEVLVVNDCATDNSADIINTYQKKDARIISITHKKNSGSGVARNTGLAQAKGEYIYFLDADDFLHERAIESLYTQITAEKTHSAKNARETSPPDIVIGGYVPIKDKDYTQDDIQKIDIAKVQDKYYAYRNTQRVDGTQNILALFGKPIDKNGILPPSWNKLYKKTLFTDNNIQYLGGVHTEDLATTPKILLCTQSVLLTTDTYYYYRLRDNSATSKANVSLAHQKKLLFDHYASIQSVKEFFIQKDNSLHIFNSYFPILQKMFQTNLFQVVNNANMTPEVQRKCLALFFELCAKETNEKYSLIDAVWYIDIVFSLLEFPQLTHKKLYKWIWFATLPMYKKPLYLLRYCVSFLLSAVKK